MALRFAEKATGTYDYPLTVRHLLDSVLQTSGDQEIVYRDQLRYTYRDLFDRISRLASLLKMLGAEEGATVAVLDWDSHRYLEAFFAIPMMGNVLQTVNIRLSSDQIHYSLDHSKAEVLIVHRDFYDFVEQHLPRLPTVRAVIAIEDGRGASPPPFAVGEYEEMIAAARSGYDFRDFDENAVATTFYTSGTTGLPKGVCFTHRQLVLHTLAKAVPLGVLRNPWFGLEYVYMPLTPMFHVHAWGAPYVATMLGMKQVYPGRYDFDLVCQLKEREGVSYSHCVPTVLQSVLDAAERRDTNLDGWTMIIGGSALSPALRRRALTAGMRIMVGYGMSETGPSVSLGRQQDSPLSEGDPQAFQRSWPVPLVSARVVDDEMVDVPSDGKSQGELVLRAPWFTPCYVHDLRASEDLWRGGWMHTQDIATIDQSGAVALRDRLKDVIKTGGEWVASPELEELILENPKVREVAVIGMTDARWGERPMAVIVLAEDCSSISLEEINASIQAAIDKGRISRYARIDRVEVVSALPKTSVGKLDKKKLRLMFA